MIEAVESATFKRWVQRPRNRLAVARLNAHFSKVTLGHFGDAKSVAEGIFEIRTYHGLGFRLYNSRDGTKVVVLLCGGQKDAQTSEIERARQLAEEWG